MTPDEYPCETEEYKNACANMTPTPETLRELLNKLLPIDEFDYERAEVWNRGHEAADAWEGEREGLRFSLETADETIAGLRIQLSVAEENYTMAYADNVSLRKRLEAAEKAASLWWAAAWAAARYRMIPTQGNFDAFCAARQAFGDAYIHVAALVGEEKP